MKKEIEKFLEFNGKRIYFVAADGQYWLAIKPICEALGVDFERQRKNLKSDKILSQLPSEQAVVAADGKLRKMLCLPEFVVYGWLFRIKSDAPGVDEYQWECYKVLYDHFHGMISGRKELISQKARITVELGKLYKAIEKDETLKKIDKLERAQKIIQGKLRTLDRSEFDLQKNLWEQDFVSSQ